MYKRKRDGVEQYPGGREEWCLKMQRQDRNSLGETWAVYVSTGGRGEVVGGGGGGGQSCRERLVYVIRMRLALLPL